MLQLFHHKDTKLLFKDKRVKICYNYFTTKTQSFRRSFSEGAKFFLKDKRVKNTKMIYLTPFVFF